jgi:ribosomal protein S4E
VFWLYLKEDLFITFERLNMNQTGDKKEANAKGITDGAFCNVIGGTHKGKYGIIRDINTSKTGHITITVVQDNGVRFKTLAKNVEPE